MMPGIGPLLPCENRRVTSVVACLMLVVLLQVGAGIRANEPPSRP